MELGSAGITYDDLLDERYNSIIRVEHKASRTFKLSLIIGQSC